MCLRFIYRIAVCLCILTCLATCVSTMLLQKAVGVHGMWLSTQENKTSVIIVMRIRHVGHIARKQELYGYSSCLYGHSSTRDITLFVISQCWPLCFSPMHRVLSRFFRRTKNSLLPLKATLYYCQDIIYPNLGFRRCCRVDYGVGYERVVCKLPTATTGRSLATSAREYIGGQFQLNNFFLQTSLSDNEQKWLRNIFEKWICSLFWRCNVAAVC